MLTSAWVLAKRAMLSMTALLASAMSLAESSGSMTPRDTRSGPARTVAVSRSRTSVTTRMPSSARCRRSRSTACSTSPTPSPSTKTNPVSILSPRGVDHLPQLVLLGMAGDVHMADLGVEHVRTMPVQVVHRLVHHALIARDRASGDDDPVPLQHIDQRMALGREAR